MLTSQLHANDCIKPVPGIYVPDNTANARLDGGKIDRVIDMINTTSLTKKTLGTTGQFGLAVLIGDENAIYKTIGNMYDERLETLSIQSSLKIDYACEKIYLEYEASGYYPNFIKIGSKQTKKQIELPSKFKARIEGIIKDENTILISLCTPSEQDTKTKEWKKSTSEENPLCSTKNNYKIFNIAPYIKNKAEWRTK